MKEISKADRLNELDALRGIAALAVVFFHLTKGIPSPYLFKVGVTGVDLFFIISGFVIFMSLDKITKSSDFVINRLSRLYPTYWAAVTFTFLLRIIYSIYMDPGFAKPGLIFYAVNMSMFQFYFKVPDMDGPYWTLIIEMLFYMIILFLFHFKLLKYLNIIGVVSSALVVAANIFFPSHSLVTELLYWIPLLQFVPLFLAGVIFYKIFSSKENAVQNYAIIFFCLICQIIMFHHSGRSNTTITYTAYVMVLITYFSLFVLFVNKKLSFIVSRTTVFLGTISYALYLTHQFFATSIIIPLLVNTFKMNFWVAAFLIALPLCILVASLITFYIEVPIRRLMKERLRKLLLSF